MDDQALRSEPSSCAVRSGTPTGRTIDVLDATDVFKRRAKLTCQIVPDSALRVDHGHEAFTEGFTNGSLGRGGYTR